MKIEFDKTILWLLPYLYLVSIVYYWGYWGIFNVDVFNYYQISDLIKGITSPISYTFLFTAGAGLAALAFISLLRMIGKGWVILLIMGCLVCGRLILEYISVHEPHKSITHQAIDETSILWEIMAGVSIGISGFIAYRLPKSEGLSVWAKTLLIYIGLIFVCRAYIDGYQKAWLIKKNLSFDYIVEYSSGSHQKEIVKFLGKAGDYYILLTLDNSRRIIVPSSEIKYLMLTSYSVEDKASLSRFRRDFRQSTLNK